MQGHSFRKTPSAEEQIGSNLEPWPWGPDRDPAWPVILEMVIEHRAKIEKSMRLQEGVATIFSPFSSFNVVVEFKCDCERVNERERARFVAQLVGPRFLACVAMCVVAVLSPPCSGRVLRNPTLVGVGWEKSSKTVEQSEEKGLRGVFSNRSFRKLSALARGACVTNDRILFMAGFYHFKYHRPCGIRGGPRRAGVQI